MGDRLLLLRFLSLQSKKLGCAYSFKKATAAENHDNTGAAGEGGDSKVGRLAKSRGKISAPPRSEVRIKGRSRKKKLVGLYREKCMGRRAFLALPGGRGSASGTIKVGEGMTERGRGGVNVVGKKRGLGGEQ